MTKIVCFGPGPMFKGGISDYNTALAKALQAQPNAEVTIVSWLQQYPSIVPRDFIDRSSKSDLLDDSNIGVHYITNYNNPFTWNATAKLIAELKPDIVIFQWAIAIQGLPIGRIINKLKKLSTCEVIIDLHFVIQKEGSALDSKLTKMGISNADTYICHAYKTVDELKTLFPKKSYTVNESGKRGQNTVIKLFHPIYSLFKEDPLFDIAAFKKENHLKKHVFLFFGFIRKYKGLHNAIKAFKLVADQRDDVSFLICGESFWKTVDQTKWTNKMKSVVFNTLKSIVLKKSGNEQEYNPLALIEELHLSESCVVFNEFVPNEEVHKYFQVSDAVLLFYEYATPSGIESLSYNFKKPLLATSVGHFPETIQDGYNGYLCKAEDIEDMAATMLKYLDNPLNPENVVTKTKALSWENYAKAILNR